VLRDESEPPGLVWVAVGCGVSPRNMLTTSVSISGYFATLVLLVVISLALRGFDQPVDQPGPQLLSDHGQHGHHTHARVLPLLSGHPTLPAAPGGSLYCCECLSVVARCTSLDSLRGGGRDS